MIEMLRRAKPEDAARLAELDALCFTVPWSRQSFDTELSSNQAAVYLVLEVEGVIVAYAGFWSILDERHITNVAVHPDFRRQGRGGQIIEALIQAGQTTGLIRYTLEVRQSNQAAIRLYEKAGFVTVGRRKGYYEDNGEDALIMWRLPPGETYEN